MVLLIEKDGKEIDPVVWVKEGNRERLNIPPLKLKLKREGDVVNQKQYPIPLEGHKGLQPVIEALIKDGLLAPCVSPFYL